ncbi:hypothetical protein [Saudi moumouvirus]|nr:hypothetical protein [Saudi moumouvirus]
MAYNYIVNLNTIINIHEIYKLTQNINQLGSEWVIYLSSKQFHNSVGLNIKNNSTIINCRIFNNQLSLISSKEFDFGLITEMLLDKFRIFKSEINNIKAKYIYFDTQEKKYNEIILPVPVL